MAESEFSIDARGVTLNVLAAHLGYQEFRNQFREEAASALHNVGINPDILPTELLTTLAGMTDEQLAMIAEIQRAMMGSVPDWVKVAIFF